MTLYSTSQPPANGTLLIFIRMSTLCPTGQNRTILAWMWPNQSCCLSLAAVTVNVLSFFLHGDRLEQVHHFKYLGVWLSDDLTWEKHVEYVTNKARRHLGYIFRMFSLSGSPDSLIRLYHSQVLPLIDYRCVVWDPHLVKHKQQLETIRHKDCFQAMEWVS